MTARGEVAARMCSGCACRPGSFANACERTQDDLSASREDFRCHHTASGLGACAGAVARFGTDDDVAAFLADPPDVVEGFVGVTDGGACEHVHATAAEALACARAADPLGTVGRSVVPDWPWFARLTDDELDALDEPRDVLLRPYHVVRDGHAGECNHAHWTEESAWACFIERGSPFSTIERHDEWPTRTGQRGVVIV